MALASNSSARAVRNTTVAAAAAGVAVVGTVAPAQAYAVADTTATSTYAVQEAAASYPVYESSYTYLAPAAEQPVANSYVYNSTYTAPAATTTDYVSSAAATQNFVAAPAANTTANLSGVVGTAYSGIGGSYVWGGKSFGAWDCSGYVSWVYAQHGINLTAYTFAMVNELTPTSNPQPGDIVFQNGFNHVGIYIGNGQMISALNPAQGTQIHSVNAMSVDGFYTVG